MGPHICFLILCFTFALAPAQQQTFNGQLKPSLYNAGGGSASNCGQCPPGTERAPSTVPYACGVCLPAQQNCAPGNVKVGNSCQQCPCPGNGAGAGFGTNCYVDNGSVRCNCSENYAGPDCSRCAPGCVQQQKYPYSCIRPGNTNCAGNNNCPQVLPPVVVPPPPVACPTCPANNCGTNCGTNCGVKCPERQNCPQCPVPQPCPQPCPLPQPCPQCPVPQPCPQPCPLPQPCPQPCPLPQPCPQCPQCPQQCAQCPQCPGNQCPDCNCPQCPNVECPQCPSPCQPCPPTPPCNPCPAPCQRCPDLICGSFNQTECQNPCPEVPPCGNCSMTVVVGGCEAGRDYDCCDIRGRIENYAGKCFCKENVEGYQCSSCKKGYFGLSEFNALGCSKCFCSGVSDYCKVSVFYRTTLQATSTFHIAEVTSEGITVIDSVISSGGTASKSFALARRTKLLWDLPAEFLGNRITSYGARLSCSRRYNGANPLGSDHDVIIVGARGGVIYWSSFKSPQPNAEQAFSVLLSEQSGWVVAQDDVSRPASRADILFVLSEIQAIYVRASFSATTSSTVIRDCKLETVSESLSAQGLVLDIEQCRCPPGYRGLSCESCTHGYYRDVSDTGRSVFGACKKCPCGPHADGCIFELGHVICNCRRGYSGLLCQDREYLTLSMDPFRIREIVNTVVQFNCSYITNSKNAYTLEISTLPQNIVPTVDTTSQALQCSVPLTSTLTNVVCKLKDATGFEVACAKATIVIDVATTTAITAPPPLVSIIASHTFICVNETESIEFNCTVIAYGLSRVNIDWRKETVNGTIPISKYELDDMRRGAKQSHGGTYICSATVGNVTAIERIAVVVIPVVATITGRNIGGKTTTYTGSQTVYVRDDPNAYGNGTNVLTTTEDPKKVQSDSSMVIEKRPEGFPTIRIEPLQLTVKVGEPATLKCEASGKAPLKYYWKSGRSSYIPHHVRAAHGSLMFSAVTKEDEGEYYCIAWNELGQSSSTATLKVLDNNNQKAPNSLLSVTPSEITAYAGENINFQCSIRDPTARIIWSRKDGELPASSSVKGDGVLTLYRVSTPNEGVYICSAIFPNGQTYQASGRLIVNSNIISIMPTIKLQPRSPHRVSVGDRVLLDCQSSGEPAPTVTWSRNVDGREVQLVVSATPSSVLEISFVTKADEGKYTCTATNRAGTKLESLSLMVDDNAINCKTSEFRCKSGDQCVAKEDRCDGEKDCKDGSDEHHCRRSNRHAN